MKEIKGLELYHSSDYSGLNFDKFRFYYGYEYGNDINGEEVWGFYLEDDKKTRLFQITLDDMLEINGCPDNCNCYAMLLFGIGIYLNQKQLKNRG